MGGHPGQSERHHGRRKRRTRGGRLLEKTVISEGNVEGSGEGGATQEKKNEQSTTSGPQSRLTRCQTNTNRASSRGGVTHGDSSRGRHGNETDTDADVVIVTTRAQHTRGGRGEGGPEGRGEGGGGWRQREVSVIGAVESWDQCEAHSIMRGEKPDMRIDC
ncbi:unnamed protein product [Boreogadus saida]